MPSSTLFTPLQLGSVTIPNRLGMSALTRNRSPSTVPNELMKQYYEQRAAGGAGLIVSEGVLITRQGGQFPYVPGIWNKAQVAGWKNITDAVHAAGGKIYAQLWHLGRAAHPDTPEQIASGEPVYAPSAIAARGGKFDFLPGNPQNATPTEIQDPTILIAQFKAAAINAKEAGFDGVELHGANGYLIHQFLDSGANKRTDKWGGSVENRARFCLETLKALIEVWGPDVALKISPAAGFNDVGMELQESLDTFGYLLREVNKLGLSYVALVRYSLSLDPELEGKRRATKHDVLASYAPFLGDTPIFVNAGVTPAEAAALVNSSGGGGVAGVFIGKDWIGHPDLAKRIKAGKPVDNVVDWSTVYGGGPDLGVGYVDYEGAVY
ncbi:flavoprotein NADH-dependent oxidoreductase [Mycena filopes]|nr:flavoprotein NADH-dependent oxidoreductase [Mycena filopes]